MGDNPNWRRETAYRNRLNKSYWPSQNVFGKITTRSGTKYIVMPNGAWKRQE